MDASFETQMASRRIVVLAGGSSAERAISLQSGRAVARALEANGRTVVELDPADADLTGYAWSSSDIVFIALHGSFGEDGAVQELLGTLGVPYTGSSAQASRLAFSKSASKLRMLQCGVPTPAFALVHQGEGLRRLPEIAARIGYPLVVKPDQQGSSLGVSFAPTESDLCSAARRAMDYGDFVVLESAVVGTEWTLAVIDDDPLPLLQIRTPNGLFDFDAKYVDDATEHCFEFDKPGAVTDGVVASGLAACRALGTSGLTRVDLMLDDRDRPWVLEVNTIPGMTDHSLAPKAAARAGLSLSTLCDRALASALLRERTPADGPHRKQPAPADSRRRAG